MTRSENDSRYQPGDGIHESFFLKANHPHKPQALWLKATLVANKKEGATCAAWCNLFDREGNRTWGAKREQPFDKARFAGEHIDVAGCHFSVHAEGGASTGTLADERGQASWDLNWKRMEGVLGDSLCLFMNRKMLDTGFPKSKAVTPIPVAYFSGTVTWDGETWDIGDWVGMQGHNWSRAAPVHYAWGHTVFLDSAGKPFCVAEALAGRIKIARKTTPLISLMTVRRGEKEYRFDRMVDFWNQDARINFPDWTLRMKGPTAEALLSMRAQPNNMMCLGYKYPADPDLRYCLNSKLASVSLRVNPVNDHAFECKTEHLGALEFLQSTAEPRVQPVI